MNGHLFKQYAELTDLLGNHVDEIKFEETFKIFSTGLILFCEEENLLQSYRLLRTIEVDFTCKMESMHETAFSKRITGLLKTEQQIIQFRISHPTLKPDHTGDRKPLSLLRWTAPKVALVELLYALSSSINDGKANMKEIVTAFQYLFQIDLGNFYDTLQSINLRKSDETRFLDSLVINFRDVLSKMNSK